MYAATKDTVGKPTPAKRVKPAEAKPLTFEQRWNKAQIGQGCGNLRGQIWKEYMDSRKAELEPQAYNYGYAWVNSKDYDLSYLMSTYVGYVNQYNEQVRKTRLAKEEAEKKYGKDSGYVLTPEDYFERAILSSNANCNRVRALPDLNDNGTICHCCGVPSTKYDFNLYFSRGFAMWERSGYAPGDMTTLRNLEGYEALLVEDPEGKCNLKLYWKDK